MTITLSPEQERLVAEAMQAGGYGHPNEAQEDLFEIWQRIALDSVDLANRIDDEFSRAVCVAWPHAGTRPYPQGSLQSDLFCSSLCIRF